MIQPAGLIAVKAGTLDDKSGVAPGIEVVSYSVTMKQDLINPYSNELQTGLPFDGSATQNGDNTVWLAGLVPISLVIVTL